MRQFFQGLLGRFDRVISDVFHLQSWGDTGDQQRERWTFYIDKGRIIGIVGVDGRIHTTVGYYSVNHYYEGDTLVRRVPVRRDLKPGERLATAPEIRSHQHQLMRQLSGGCID